MNRAAALALVAQLCMLAATLPRSADRLVWWIPPAIAVGYSFTSAILFLGRNPQRGPGARPPTLALVGTVAIEALGLLSALALLQAGGWSLVILGAASPLAVIPIFACVRALRAWHHARAL